MTVLAIDPGFSGAFALVTADGALEAIGDLPVMGDGKQRRIDAANFALLVRSLEPTSAIVERVGTMPGQGISSAFRFGEGVGVLAGVFGALAVPLAWVPPNKWKTDLGLGRDKEASRLRAIETWPKQASQFARKKDDGRAEAALLGLWAMRRRG